MGARKEQLDDKELARESAIIDDLERLLDKYMLAQEEMPDGWVIDTADEILQATIRR